MTWCSCAVHPQYAPMLKTHARCVPAVRERNQEMVRWATTISVRNLIRFPPLSPLHLPTVLSNTFRRESARERVLEVDTPSPPRHHASQDHLPRPPSMTMPGDQCLSLQSLPHRGYLPVHPRQVSRATEAYQAVFEALAMLLPLRSGGDGGAGARGGIGRMQAAAVRCGQQCQGYIRALQQGIEVCHPHEGSRRGWS